MPKIQNAELVALIQEWEEELDRLLRLRMQRLQDQLVGNPRWHLAEVGAQNRMAALNAKLQIAAQGWAIPSATLDDIAGGRICRETLSSADVVIEKLRLVAASTKAAGEAEQAGAGEPSGNGKGQAKQRGRPADTDPKADAQIAAAWDTGHYPTYADLGREKGMSGHDVELAIDRRRKRQKRAE